MTTRMPCVLAVLPLAFLPAKDPVQWKNATVIHARYQMESSASGVASAGGSSQTARGEFDFDADDFVYTVEEWVAPSARLRLAGGDKVQFAIDKKTFLLKVGDKGKIRKLKLVDSYAKPNSQPTSPSRRLPSPSQNAALQARGEPLKSRCDGNATS